MVERLRTVGAVSMAFGQIYRGRRVLVTGHTGFKGSWLCLWLTQLGADVAGYSVDVPTQPSNFELLGLDRRMRHHLGDVRDRAALSRLFDDFQPEMIFHLAAQSLVRRSYENPAATFETNALGMVNVLECIRTHPGTQVAVLITSDKAYRNDEVSWGYRETDTLGGRDPYSGSKGCAELVAYSYYHSFLRHGDTRVATTRAGNVIGGGDWAEDRIVPDCIRAWSQCQAPIIRSPQATRPWQHVLEPLSGYLWLGAELWRGRPELNGEAFNFGPDANVDQTVGELLAAMAERWPGARWEVAADGQGRAREATLLKLSCDKALQHLGWRAVLQFPETVAFTVDWYRSWSEGAAEAIGTSAAQLERYCALAAERGLAWTRA